MQRNIRNKPWECKRKEFGITYGEAQNRPFVTFGGSAGKIKEDKKRTELANLFAGWAYLLFEQTYISVSEFFFRSLTE